MPAQGVYRGRVLDTSDLAARGRVRIMVPAVGAASVMAPVVYTCNCAWGIQVGATVIVAFEGGDVAMPVVLGQID